MSDGYIELYKANREEIKSIEEEVTQLRMQIHDLNELSLHNTTTAQQQQNIMDIAATWGLPGVILMAFITQLAERLAVKIAGRMRNGKKKP